MKRTGKHQKRQRGASLPSASVDSGKPAGSAPEKSALAGYVAALVFLLTVPIAYGSVEPLAAGYVAAQPYASLSASRRVFAEEEEDTIEVLVAFGIAVVCRDCGEQLQLTSSDVPAGVKFARLAALHPHVQQVLDALPSSSTAPWTMVEGYTWGQCCRCDGGLETAPWIELLLAYERYEVDAEQRSSITIIGDYESACLCGPCCDAMPLSLPESGEDQTLMHYWVAGMVQLLGTAET